MPEDIMRSYFQAIDYETMYDFLDKYQKKRPEWDEYRAKIPESLLVKWGLIIKECRKNGFIAPMAKDGKIVFRQIQAYNRESVDNCTLCINNLTNRTCRGSLKHINNRRMFVKCWERS